jgi:hypothetical protein
MTSSISSSPGTSTSYLYTLLPEEPTPTPSPGTTQSTAPAAPPASPPYEASAQETYQDQYRRELQALSDGRERFDTANQDTIGSIFQPGPDQSISTQDIEAVASHPDAYGAPQVEAAHFFLDHPQAQTQLSGNVPGAAIAFSDLDQALAESSKFAGAATFVSTYSTVPQQPTADESDAERAASVALQQEFTIGGGYAFQLATQEHVNDAPWLNGFLRSLGSDKGGQFIYEALTYDTEASDTARAVIATLQQAGDLNAHDAAVATFTRPGSNQVETLGSILNATPEGGSRPLTVGEQQLLAPLFGPSIDSSQVRVHNGEFLFPLQPDNIAMTPNGELYFNPQYFKEDFSTASPSDQRWFMHEMVHVWQHQQGYPVAARGALRVGLPYEYNLAPDTQLGDYNMEAQGEILADYWALKNDHPEAMHEPQYAGDLALYEGVLQPFLSDPADANNLPPLA